MKVLETIRTYIDSTINNKVYYFRIFVSPFLFPFSYFILHFQIVPRSVSTVETKCFMPWNKLFQAMKQSVSYGETKCFKRLKLFETPVDRIERTAPSGQVDRICCFNSPVLSEGLNHYRSIIYEVSAINV